MRWPSGMGELLHTSDKENCSISTGIQLSCYKLYLGKHTLSGMEHTPLKERKNRVPGLAYSAPSPSPRAGQCCLPQPICMVCTAGQVPQVANIPLLKTRWARLVLHWHNHLATVSLVEGGRDPGVMRSSLEAPAFFHPFSSAVRIRQFLQIPVSTICNPLPYLTFALLSSLLFCVDCFLEE